MSIILPDISDILDKYQNRADDVNNEDLDKIKKKLHNAKLPPVHGNVGKRVVL